MKRIILLDFDGVLCNSMNECMIVSYNTYYKQNIKDINLINTNKRKFFYKYRNYVRPAEEYYLIWNAFDNNIEITKNTFNDLKNNFKKEIADFKNDFYHQRDLLKKSLNEWLQLHTLYDNVKSFLHNTNNKFFIVTNKDKESVELISKYYEYYDNIHDIYSMEISSDKRVLIKKLLKHYNINTSNSEIIFIDDNIMHIEDIESMNINIKTYLANWGYVNSDNLYKNQIDNLDFIKNGK